MTDLPLLSSGFGPGLNVTLPLRHLIEDGLKYAGITGLGFFSGAFGLKCL